MKASAFRHASGNRKLFIYKLIKGAYKVARGLYSNTKGDPQGLVKKFIDYLFSAEGRKIVAEKGFIPVD